MEYRTDEQWNSICDCVTNGNWTQAGKEAVKFGFWSNDMIKKQLEEREINERTQITDLDLVTITEIAMKRRAFDGYYN